MAGHGCQSVSESEMFKVLKNHTRGPGTPATVSRLWPPTVRQQDLTLTGASLWRLMFPKTGFPKSCEDCFGKPAKTSRQRTGRKRLRRSTSDDLCTFLRVKTLAKMGQRSRGPGTPH